MFKLPPLSEHSSYHIQDLLVDGVTPADLKSFIARVNPFTKIFDVEGSIIRTSHFVGMVACDDILLQVHPKLLKFDSNNQSYLLSNLSYLLSVTQNQDEILGDLSSEVNGDIDLFDFVIKNYAGSLLSILRRDPMLRYTIEEIITSKPRGRINLFGTLRVQVSNKARMSCVVDELSENNFELQVFKYICRKSLTLTSNDKIKSNLRSCLNLMSRVSDINIGVGDISKIVLSRQSRSYEKPLRLGKMILKWLAPNFRGASIEPLSIEFNMNQLFERYLGYICRKYRDNLKLVSIVEQKPISIIDTFTDFESGGVSICNRDGFIDTFLETDDGKAIVLDAKYKALDVEPGIDVSLNDIYQIETYSNLYSHPYEKITAALIYPTNKKNLFFGLGNIHKKRNWYVRTLDLHRDLRSSEDEIVKELQQLIFKMTA